MFGLEIRIAPNGTLHVLMPYAQHFSRGTGRLGRRGYCLDPKTGRLLYAY